MITTRILDISVISKTCMYQATWSVHTVHTEQDVSMLSSVF